MNKLIFILLLIFFLFSSHISFAQEPNAKQIIENLYMSSTLGQIKDMIIDTDIYGPTTGKQEEKKTMEIVANAKVFFYSPNKIRTERTIFIQGSQSDEYIVSIRDGRMAYQYTPYSDRPASQKEDDHKHSLFLPFGIDRQPQDQFRTYTYIGVEIIGDRNAYVISVINDKDPDSKITNVWIDTERFVPLKEEYTLVETKDDQVKETKKITMYKDIKQLPDGRWMPFKVEKYDNSKMNLYMSFKSLVVNVGLPINMFSQPVSKL